MKFSVILGFAMAMLFLLGSAVAENYSILFSTQIDTSYDVQKYDISVTRGQASPTSSNGEMSLEILRTNNNSIFSTSFTPSFLLLTDPPQELNETTVILTLPYYQNAKYLKIYYNGTEKLSVDLQSELCNSNGKCDNHENYYSCPNDCKVCAKDGVCASLSYDGCCDPDCPARLDLDCSCGNKVCEEWENYKTCPKDCPSGGRDGYCDGLKDGKCDPDCERRQDIDCTCPDKICELFETHETCPQDCPPEYQASINDFIGAYWIYILAGGIAAVAIVAIVVIKRKKHSVKDVRWKPLIK